MTECVILGGMPSITHKKRLIQIKVNAMNDTRNIAIDVLDNLEYRLGVFDDVLRFLDTDTLVDIALYLMRINGDDAELDTEDLKQITEYARIHGIEG